MSHYNQILIFTSLVNTTTRMVPIHCMRTALDYLGKHFSLNALVTLPTKKKKRSQVNLGQFFQKNPVLRMLYSRNFPGGPVVKPVSFH